jgi:hypothetical protein
MLSHLLDLSVSAGLLQRLVEVHAVAGCRVDSRDPRLRRFASADYNPLQQMPRWRRVGDVSCALEGLRRQVFDRVEMSSHRFLIDAELYARACHAGISRGSSPVRGAGVRESAPEWWRSRRSPG